MGVYKSFKHGFHLQQILLQTLVVMDSESCQGFFPSFCGLGLKSVVAVY